MLPTVESSLVALGRGWKQRKLRSRESTSRAVDTIRNWTGNQKKWMTGHLSITSLTADCTASRRV